MIAIVSVRQTADKPNFPLRPLAVFTGSSMTLGVVDVPPTREGIAVTDVSLAVENAAGAVVSASAVESGGVWTATIPASHFAAVGVVAMGVTISASGTDENGSARSWIVGKGDLSILLADGVPVPGETLQNVHLRDSVPQTPIKGDLCKGANGWQIYTGDAWAVIANVPSPSTVAPLMDGTASAGSSAAYARGDHRHPTDTSRASTADATLAERTGQSDDWQFGPLTTTDTDYSWAYTTPEYSNGVWTTEITNGPDFATLTANGGADATYLEFATASGATPTASGVVWRSANGYRLGSQDEKPLASEAEAEALRAAVAAKQDALSAQQLANIEAVPGKLDKSGGTMTGPLILNGDNIGVSVTDGTTTTAITKNAIVHTEQTSSQAFRTVTNTLPSKDGALATTDDIPPSETWTFEVDDGQGGTTTITKNVAVYAAGGNA